MSQTLSRRHVMIGASSLTVAGSIPAMAAPAPTPIVIADATGGLNLIMAALLKQEKFLESFGLQPNVMGVADGSKILAGLVGGSVDCSMMAGFGQAFPAIERGAPIKILGGGALLPTLAMFTAKPDVKSLKDLEGRTVGTGSVGALLYQLTVTVLQKYNVDVSKVRFVNVGSSSDVFKATAEGGVDAGTGETALIDTASEYHVRPIPHGNMSIELPEYTFQGAWTSDHTIATKRDTLVRSLAAYAKLYRFVQDPSNKDAFFRAARTARKSATDKDHEAEWNYIQKYKPYAVDLVLDPERLRYMQALNVEFKVQKAVLPFDKVADMSLAKDAIKLLG